MVKWIGLASIILHAVIFSSQLNDVVSSDPKDLEPYEGFEYDKQEAEARKLNSYDFRELDEWTGPDEIPIDIGYRSSNFPDHVDLYYWVERKGMVKA